MQNSVLLTVIVIVMAMVFLITYYIHTKNQTPPVSGDNSMGEKVKIVLPLKLKAYERLIIFMERIKPSSLIMRLNSSSLSSGQLQLECLKAIREEFEHNLSMQMYVSEKTWLHVKAAKEETLELVKLAGNKVAPNGSSMDLAKAILALEGETKNTHLDLAISMLKIEAKPLITT